MTSLWPALLAAVSAIWEVVKAPVALFLGGLATYYLKKLTRSQAHAATTAVSALVASNQAVDLVTKAIGEIKQSTDGRDQKLEHIRALVNSQRSRLIQRVAQLTAQIERMGATPEPAPAPADD